MDLSIVFFPQPPLFTFKKKSNGGKTKSKIRDMSFCSHSVSLSYPLHQSKPFPQLTAERLTCITPARTYTRTHLRAHINVLRFKTESRSETLKFQQSPSDFGRKVWRKIRQKACCRCAAVGSCHIQARVARPDGFYDIKESGRRLDYVTPDTPNPHWTGQWVSVLKVLSHHTRRNLTVSRHYRDPSPYHLEEKA